MESAERPLDVSVVACDAYEPEQAKAALSSLLAPLGGLCFVKPGDRLVIKANLITFLKPDKAATTHPVLLSALTELLRERGASVVIGDSPGGPFSLPYLKRVYAATGLNDCEKTGAVLNQNTAIKEADFPEARVMKHFTYTAYLEDCDYIIDFCKLKTHGMMGLTGGCKNMFGAIPGTDKPEYHYRYPNPTDFITMVPHDTPQDSCSILTRISSNLPSLLPKDLSSNPGVTSTIQMQPWFRMKHRKPSKSAKEFVTPSWDQVPF